MRTFIDSHKFRWELSYILIIVMLFQIYADEPFVLNGEQLVFKINEQFIALFEHKTILSTEKLFNCGFPNKTFNFLLQI